jgi:preprotein translocase subunit Sec63
VTSKSVAHRLSQVARSLASIASSLAAIKLECARTPAEVIGLREGEAHSAKAIKTAYRSRSKKFHADVNPRRKSSNRRMIELTAARDALLKGTDHERRRRNY